MTYMRCVTIMEPCREDITQVTDHHTQPMTDVPVVVLLTGFVLMNAFTRYSYYFIALYLVAHCKNSIDGQWYCFDDSDVHPISEDEVCKQTAYILFYQRRATIPSWSANSSVGGNYY